MGILQRAARAQSGEAGEQPRLGSVLGSTSGTMVPSYSFPKRKS